MRKDREIFALVGFNRLPVSKEVVEVLESEGFSKQEIEQATKYADWAINARMQRRYKCGKCATRLLSLMLMDLDGTNLKRTGKDGR